MVLLPANNNGDFRGITLPLGNGLYSEGIGVMANRHKANTNHCIHWTDVQWIPTALERQGYCIGSRDSLSFTNPLPYRLSGAGAVTILKKIIASPGAKEWIHPLCTVPAVSTSQIGITGYQILHLRRSKRGCFRLAFVIGDGVGLELYHEP